MKYHISEADAEILKSVVRLEIDSVTAAGPLRVDVAGLELRIDEGQRDAQCEPVVEGIVQRDHDDISRHLGVIVRRRIVARLCEVAPDMIGRLKILVFDRQRAFTSRRHPLRVRRVEDDHQE
jgi:hypothetical protein